MANRQPKIYGNRGFTLVEVLVVLALTGIVMTVIYSMFFTQNKAFTVQEQVAAMQQNLRAAIEIMEIDLRASAYDPRGSANPKFVTIASDEVQFQVDQNGDGEIDGTEVVRYQLYDSDGDGTLDELRREEGGGGLSPMAENIDVLDLVYLDKDNAPTTDLRELRSIQVTLIARTGRPDPDYQDNQVYTNQQGATILDKSASPDQFRRQMLSAQIKCRNLGLL